MIKENIMTYYSFRKIYSCSDYITIRRWNKLNGNQVKNNDILKYIESFYGKTGTKCKKINKKINSKVIVITDKDGYIKKFRLNPYCTLDIIKIQNPFNNKNVNIINDSKESNVKNVFKTKNDRKLELKNDEKDFINNLFKGKTNIADIFDFEDIPKENYVKISFVKNPKIKNAKINTKKIKKIIDILNNTDEEDENDVVYTYKKYKYDIAYYFGDKKFRTLKSIFLLLFSMDKRLEMRGGKKWW